MYFLLKQDQKTGPLEMIALVLHEQDETNLNFFFFTSNISNVFKLDIGGERDAFLGCSLILWPYSVLPLTYLTQRKVGEMQIKYMVPELTNYM